MPLLDFKPKSRFAYVVSANERYVPELCAELNSLDYIGSKDDVHVIGHQLPESFTSQFGKVGYQVVHHAFTDQEAQDAGGPSEILCRQRYYFASEIGQQYDAICILDADMFFVRPVTQYFEIAYKTGFILGAALEQKRVYGEIENQKVDRQSYLPAPRWYPRDICCSPIFVNVRDHADFGAAFKEMWEIFRYRGFKAPDMEALNIVILHHHMEDRVLLLSNPQWVGTNEKALKPYIRVIWQTGDESIWTETGDPVYICHGQFYKAVWRRQQILNREGCIKGYLGGSEKALNMAKGALELLHRRFTAMLDWNIQVEKIAYTPNGHPEIIETNA